MLYNDLEVISLGKGIKNMPEHPWSQKKCAQDTVEKFNVLTTTVTGFSLIELLIVVGIISVIGAVGTPALLSQLPDYRLNGAARTVSSTLQFAKMSAASAGKEYRVEFLLDTSPQRYQLQKGNAFRGSDSWATIQTDHFIPPQVRIDHATDYRGTHHTGTSIIAFNPTGTASSGGVYLENNKGKLRSVKVSSSTGRVRIAPEW
jgi:prepilin-type N-terminal cleavage/methylation domain-containing protein